MAWSMNDLGDFLLKHGLISSDQLHAAQKECTISGKDFEAVLSNMGLVSDETLRAAQAHTLGIESVNLEETAIQPEALNLIPREKASAWQVMPLAFGELPDSCTLTLAMTQTDNIVLLDAITHDLESNFQKPCHLRVFFAPNADIEKAIAEHYGNALSIDQLLKDLESALNSESTIVHLVDAFLIDAVFKGASDIHFEPEAGFLRIRYRIDGLLESVKVLHLSHWKNMAVRLKVLANMDIAENRDAQDGRMTRNVLGRAVDFRISILPTLHGENMVLRVLDRSKSVMAFADLGLDKRQTSNIFRLLNKPAGIVLVAGPTGCGKTTTLYSLLSYIHNEHIHVMTLEDPVEYPMPFFRQLNVEETKLDFVSGVRAMLRHDPDVILIGEIRDNETAQMAFRAAMTGHQVFSTLHSNSALAALPRLFDLKVPADILATHLNGIIAQRLVRQLCPFCKKGKTVGATLAKALNDAQNAVHFAPDSEIFTAQGCAKCRKGYASRLAIMEILTMNDALESAIFERKSRQSLAQIATESGFEDGFKQVLLGKTTLSELTRVLDLGFLGDEIMEVILGEF